jgi:hypothetical protein
MKTWLLKLTLAQINLTLVRAFVIVLLFLFSLLAPVIYSQNSGVQPTPIPGINTIIFVAGTNTYKFYHYGNLCYEYTVLPGNTTNGGTFNVLKAYADDGTWFLPSNFGGVSAILEGVNKMPWGEDEYGYANYYPISHQLIGGNTVEAYWRMEYGYEFIYYRYKLSIEGRTLIIRVEVDNLYRNATGLYLDRSEYCHNPTEAIAIPYLNLFHILLSNNIYTSFFSDWELSNASQYLPCDGSHYEPSPTTSVRYAHNIVYNPKYDGNQNNIRNRLLETLYLTTSPNIENVFPNVPNLVSENKEEMANWIPWYYGEEFRYLTNNPSNWHTPDMDILYNAGIKNIWLIINVWQNAGYDAALPCVLPANQSMGGTEVLNSVIYRARNEYKYQVGLHENYVDFYPDAGCSPYGWNSDDVALDSYGNPIEAWPNGSTQSYLLKPSRVYDYVDHWTEAIQNQHPLLNSCYLDVHSGVGPQPQNSDGQSYVDYDNTVPNAGMFRETVQNYRNIYSIARTKHHGPVMGEGGNQIFYQGYVDDVDARLTTPPSLTTPPPPWLSKNLPVIPDFDMKKMRDKTFVHGVGWYPLFYCVGEPPEGELFPPLTDDDVLEYIATTLAYGHGGYLPTPNITSSYVNNNYSMEDLIRYAQFTYNHVFSIQKDYANATPILIEYFDGTLKSASDYIRSHPDNYKNIASNEFMGRVKITYDNGMIIYVNRNNNLQWIVTEGVPGGWYNYNDITGPHVENRQNTTFTLPVKNGWLVYDPLKTKVTFTNETISGNAGGELLLDNYIEVNSGEHWYLRMGSSHDVKTMNERFVTDSIRKHNNWKGISSNYSLLTNFSVIQQNQFQNAKFTGLNPVTIKTNLLEGGSGGKIQFKEPWYVEQDGSQLNTFKEWPSPFSPTGAYGETSGGVFLNQRYDIPGNTYYSVKALSYQDINLGELIGIHRFYFQNWSYDPNKISLQTPTSNQTAVVFKTSDAELTANLKGSLLSDDEDGYKSNSQRKFVRDNDGWLYHVYTSQGRVWLETSSDNGGIWELGNNGQPLDNGEGKQPSIDWGWFNSTHNIFVVVYQEKFGNNSKVRAKCFIREADFDLEYVDDEDIATISEDYYSTNTTPVVGLYPNSEPNAPLTTTIIWKNGTGNLWGWYGNSSDNSISKIMEPLSLNGTTSNSVSPTIYARKKYVAQNWNLAWEELGANNTSSIRYAILGGRLSIGPITTVSDNNFSKNYSPSILVMENDGLGRLCWVGYRYICQIPPDKETDCSGYAQYKVIFKGLNNLTRHWEFGNNVSGPNINKKDNNTSDPYYAFAWYESTGQNKFADNSLSTVRTLNTIGQDVQVSNGSVKSAMYCMSFNHNAGVPYYFEKSNSLGSFYTLEKIQYNAFTSGREGVVSIDSAGFYFALGDIQIDGQPVDFIEIADTVPVNTLAALNEYMVSEPIAVSDNCSFVYSVQYGINDSLSAATAMVDNRFVRFKVQLIDNNTGEVIGEYDNISYNSENIYNYGNISYQVNTEGIGNRSVRLKLIVDNNFASDYSLGKIYSDESVLGKTNVKQIDFTGDKPITSYALSQNYPNPFNPSTSIKFEIPKDGLVTLKIYDILGAEIATLVNEEKTTGRYEVNFSASSLASGVYLYRIQVNDFVDVKKMILMK